MVKKYLNQIKELRYKNNFSIAVAESCTGGMLSSYLTSIDGSSTFFEGSIVSYSNFLKCKLLKVSGKTIKKYGAVSDQTALEMVMGLEKICKSEIFISITGVAGPGGGSKKAPVGCVFFGMGIKTGKKYEYSTEKKIFGNYSRLQIQKKSTEFALKKIIKLIKKI